MLVLFANNGYVSLELVTYCFILGKRLVTVSSVSVLD